MSLVINYDLPNSRELYIHRIGRSGRYGRKVCSLLRPLVIYCVSGCRLDWSGLVSSSDDLPAAPQQGVAINFVRSDDIRILRDIEQCVVVHQPCFSAANQHTRFSTACQGILPGSPLNQRFRCAMSLRA